MGKKAKTDAIDAAVIRHFASVRQFPNVIKPSKNVEKLTRWVKRRRQLSDQITAVKNQYQATIEKDIKRDMAIHLRFLEGRLEKAVKLIQKSIAADDKLQEKNRRLQTVPGVGPVLSATLLAQFSELGQLTRRSAAALLGVAPFNFDSGKSSGKRRIYGGRHQVRRVAYMATVPAATRFTF